MKLNYKYTIAYAFITFIVLSIGFAIVYASIQRSARQTVAGKLEHLNKVIEQQLQSGKDYTGHPSRRNVQITPISNPGVAAPSGLASARKEWNEELQDTVKMVQLSAITIVNGQAYKITSKAILVEPEDIYLNGIILVFAWTFVFLLALVVVLSEVLSWYILKPFNDTLEAIQQFQINQEKTIAVHDTQTSEFKELNAFLVKMTNKARSDYIALKEFSENASHELQTPIATMKAKIELLMETPLEERQLNTLSEIHNELERVSRINHSLTLLATLEHFDLDNSQQVDFRELLQEVLSRFADWIEMKDIKVTSKVNVAVAIRMDASLAQMVLNNLVSNAIRHNQLQGMLRVALTPHALIIQNTGEAPAINVDEVFGRFKKGNRLLDSVGIGLAIVKKICDLYEYPISYHYENGWHTVTINFPGERLSPEAK